MTRSDKDNNMKGLALTLIMTLACSMAHPQEVRRMSCEECVDEALSNSLMMKREERNVERARVLTATAFDAPGLEVELSQDATEGGGMDNGLSVSQEFDFPTLYMARRKALKADYRVAQGEYVERRNELKGEVMSAYYSLIYLREKQGVMERQTAVYKEFADMAEARYKAGEASRLEAINAQRLRDKGEKALREVRVELARCRMELSVLTGVEAVIEPLDEELRLLEGPELWAAEDLVPEQTLRGQLMGLEVERSERMLNVARQEFMPSLKLSATNQLLISGFNPYHIERSRFEKGNFMGFSVGLAVPLFFGARRARLMAARQDVEMAMTRKGEEAALMKKEYAEAMNELAEARKALDYHEHRGRETASEIVRLAEVSYQLGDIGYMEYIQNMEVATDLRIEHLESMERYNQSVIKLKTIKGL